MEVGVAAARVGVNERTAVAVAGAEVVRVAVAAGRVGVDERAGVDERIGVAEGVIRAGVDVRVAVAPGALSQNMVLPEPLICPKHVIVSRSPALSTIVMGVAVN